MLLCTVQALGELAVLFPVNGAFYVYSVRFIDPAWYVCNSRCVETSMLTEEFEGFRHGLAVSAATPSLAPVPSFR